MPDFAVAHPLGAGRRSRRPSMGRLGRARRRRLARAPSSATTAASRRSASTASRPAGCWPSSTRSGRDRKFEGNPVHPGSRGRTCAKGPATINQVHDTERILKPLKRTGPRGLGRVRGGLWEEALDDIGGRIRQGARRGPPGRGRVPRRAAGRGPLRPAHAPGLGRRRAQQPHQRLQRLGAARASRCGSAGPAVAGLLADEVHAAALGAPGDRALLQPARPAHHRRQGGGRSLAGRSTRACRTRRPARGPLDLALAGQRGGAACSAWPHASCSTSGRSTAIRRALDQLARLARGARRGTGRRSTLPRVPDSKLRRYTPEFVAEECRIAGGHGQELADEIAAAGCRFASHLWRNTASGQPRRLAGRARPAAAARAHRQRRAPGRVNPNSWDKFVPKPSENPPIAPSGTSASGRASGRSPTTR